jgi:hypothetical protein
MRTLADISGDNAVHTINLGAPAWWAAFAVTGTGTVRLGDGDTSSSRGFPITSSAAFICQFRGHENPYSPTFWAYVPTGATLSVAFA